MSNDQSLEQYVKLIEGAEKEERDVDEEYLETDSEELEEKSEDMKYKGSKHGKDDFDENDDADERVEEVLSEENDTFWENFEEDSDFEIDENNGMYCVRGTDTNFHYGSHVSYDCAADHVESLKDYTE